MEKKIARVQPQVHSQPIVTAASAASTPSSTTSRMASNIGKVDPIKALSSMASQPMTSTVQSNSTLSISHSRQNFDVSGSYGENQRSVGTQAKIGAPVKIISPRPWKSHINQDAASAMSSGVSTSTSR